MVDFQLFIKRDSASVRGFPTAFVWLYKTKTGFLRLTIRYDLASWGLGMKSFSPEASSWIQDFMGPAKVWCL